MIGLDSPKAHLFSLTEGQTFRLAPFPMADRYTVTSVDERGYTFADSLGQPVSAMALILVAGGLFVYADLAPVEGVCTS